MRGIMIDSVSGDLAVKDREIAIGETTLQGVEEVLRSNRGEYKEFPLVGGEVCKLLHGNGSRFWINRAKSMCAAMGVGIKRLENNNQGEIIIGV